ncbi:CoA-binding protein [Streptomyces sp. PRh5]|uniref:CoA-binding protein n=1 Tax=Streptomyces sp. PRh5 TaxID=1158056 RepID=UPI000453A609|nr:CoA-binding protein [Streptomyces sp. PRh5]EXU62091.1 CoA-binding protein [Streptomyces sp. PRh5]
MYGDPATVRKILTELGDTWAVVRLSTNPGRAAYGVAGVLQRFGKRIVPVRPAPGPIRRRSRHQRGPSKQNTRAKQRGRACMPAWWR